MEINLAFCFQTNPPNICQSIQNKILILSQHFLKLYDKVENNHQIKLKGYGKSALKREVLCEFGSKKN